MPEIKVQEFFEEEFPNFAIYNLYRMVASYVDGLKPSQRKIIHTVMKKNITSPKKVSQLAAEVSSETQYLHGEVNLQGVIVNMVQNFVGTNNMNLLHPESSFGNRCLPQAAAARYIFTRKSSYFDNVFNPEDNPVLIHQEFEGDIIEPKFFIPTLPMVLINGSEGIGSGWAQKILPRDPKIIKKAIVGYLKTGKIKEERIAPWFDGFTGKVVHIENNSWELRGILKQINTTTYKITELPPNVSLDKFTSNLTKLEDNNIISSFTDLSDPGEDKFEFDIKVRRQFTSANNIEQAMKKFYLIKRVTENFTCIDEDNKVREFKNELQILRAYVDIRLDYYNYRKTHNVEEMEDLMGRMTSKSRFIESIIKNKLKVKDLTKKEIIQHLEKENYPLHNNSYHYLINLPIYTITKDEYKKIIDEISNQKVELDRIKNQEINDIWAEDIKKIK